MKYDAYMQMLEIYPCMQIQKPLSLALSNLSRSLCLSFPLSLSRSSIISQASVIDLPRGIK